ncbi:MAG: IS110 family transposase [Gammaproteobacteria bacterium]
MKIYQNFVGIDIGKYVFVVASTDSNTVKEFNNTPEGITEFFANYKKVLTKALVILETTGGYEMDLLFSLCQKSIDVHRANTRKVKHFIRSYGNGAKTDGLDAKALSLYGKERYEKLECYKPLNKEVIALYYLVKRREDLTKMLSAEKNRKQAPGAKTLLSSYSKVIEVLQEEIHILDKQAAELIASHEALQACKKILETIPGIGQIISTYLLAYIPELGMMNRRQIASLCGLAPRANDSGTYRGYRHTSPGRESVKPKLFLAAMAARNAKGTLKDFYEKLIAGGKKKMVALTALMRKIIVIANAKIRDYLVSNGQFLTQPE